ncbi:two-component system sensor histidine kinase BaeS [Deinococcus metalli]|uniref:histidine kinase n=1 Tax=Deinococcus metalli TaxID=1141878 RepID=A0A7W8KFM2_9DEIO|nr:ATP-binding protein [Deinococcus metalli]MBB5375659.1 two-component system sensor histidine kinase BaeS [Deinococcus metalli]GHF38005.1 two-component sensor histidine kinase [Deinococcus metalli]
MTISRVLRWAGLRRGPSLALTMLLAMLAVSLLTVASMFVLSNAVVEREVRRLPPEMQTYLRAQAEAQRRGQVIVQAPTPEVRTGSVADPYLPPGQSSPDVGGVVRNAGGQDTTISEGRKVRTRDDGGGGPRVFAPRTQDFVRQVQASLVQVGLIAAVASALLAFLLARRVAHPVSAVSRAARGLARGDLTVRAPVFRGEREVADLARTFNEMATNLQQLEQERRQAVADIAHELRTPLAVIQARLDALEDGVYPLNHDQVRMLSIQTQVLTRLVDDLRTLTLLEAGQLPLYQAQTDLAALGAQVVHDLTDRAAARGVALTLRSHPAQAFADPHRVRQILANLVENAVRHARGRVEVSVEPHDDAVLLRVDDDGPGIPASSREAVFTRFTRLDDSRQRDTGGSGLGLAIVHALAAAHGGLARADESEALGGASFRVSLPRTPQPS